MKLLLLGLTCAGKSTLAPRLAQRYGLKVLEADDEVQRLNGGVWPQDEKTIDTYFAETTPKALKMEGVVYVISSLTKSEIRQFFEAGFRLVELHASYDVIKARKVVRDTFEAYGEPRLARNFRAHNALLVDAEISRLFTVSVDGSRLEPSDVLQTVIGALES